MEALYAAKRTAIIDLHVMFGLSRYASTRSREERPRDNSELIGYISICEWAINARSIDGNEVQLPFALKGMVDDISEMLLTAAVDRRDAHLLSRMCGILYCKERPAIAPVQCIRRAMEDNLIGAATTSQPWWHPDIQWVMDMANMDSHYDARAWPDATEGVSAEAA